MQDGAVSALTEFKKRGWIIIIDTCRSDVDALKKFLDSHKVPYDYINENPYQDPDVSPTKIQCDIKLDDRAVTFRSWLTAVNDVENRYKEIGHLTSQNIIRR